MSATDELRSMAESVGLAMPQAATLMMGAADSIERLGGENAKLRELVVEVFECARRGAACETCKVNNDGYACVYIMRDLGIEVD